MKEIRMVDLKEQYLKIKDEVDSAILSVIHSSAFIKGPEVKLFEKELSEYLGGSQVIACGNGTDALQVALMSLDLKPGDEVITSNFTFIATVEVIALLGLKPVLVDPEPGTFNISADAIEEAVTDRTRVILPVHLFGQCADMEAIVKIAEEHNLFIIEDTAQALGAEYTFSDGRRMKAGTIGTIGTTSFFPSKNLGCYGDGGAIFTQSGDLAVKIRSLVNHGMTRRYYHDHIGVNSRLDSIQAAILRVKLRNLDQYNSARRSAAEIYDLAFTDIDGITIPARSNSSNHIFHQYTLKTEESRRDLLKEHLAAASIPAMIYYPVPVNRQEAYRDCIDNKAVYPISDMLSKQVISLPMHTELQQDQLDYIVSSVKQFYMEDK